MISPGWLKKHLFLKIRDCEFTANPHYTFLSSKLLALLIHHGGGCSAKHYALGILYSGMGLQVEYISVPFLWKDLPADLPKHMRDLAGEIGISRHMCLRVNQCRTVDVTWDIALGKAGFPINPWTDLKKDSSPAVIACGDPTIFASIKERQENLIISRKNLNNSELSKKQKFYTELNRWLESVRRDTKRSA